jgi:hypothetical protein
MKANLKQTYILEVVWDDMQDYEAITAILESMIDEDVRYSDLDTHERDLIAEFYRKISFAD